MWCLWIVLFLPRSLFQSYSFSISFSHGSTLLLPSSGFHFLHRPLFFLLSCDNIPVGKYTSTLRPSQSAHPHQPFTTMNWAKFSFRYSESELNFQFEQNHHIWRWKATIESKWNHIKIRANNQHIYMKYVDIRKILFFSLILA